MGLPQFSIKRPVTTMMITFGVVLFGFISLARLPQELFPPIVYPQLTVATLYANAAPEEIETLITKPIEEAVGTVSGLKRIRSVSKEGISLVMGEFGWSENMDFASLRVREKIDLIKERLPRDSGEPLVMKYNPFDRPIMTLSITGKRSPVHVRELTRIIIKDELEKVEGVASATISGGLEREILVELDQARLYAQNVPLMDVVHAITNANLNYPAGTIKESFYEYLIRTLGEFEHINEIGKIPVKSFKDENEEMYYVPEETKEKEISKGANLALLEDVADIYDTYKERTSYSRYNGRENVSVSIQKQAQANTLQVVHRVKNALKYIKEELPEDIEVAIVYDQSEFIKSSINSVRDSAIQGGILVFIVLYIFLRNLMSSAIVSFSIPISIMTVFVLMYSSSLSINLISLAGLALGVGMLVDNSIVVLENIFRHWSLGKSSEEASILGADEMVNAIMGSTLTTIVVFFPMAFVIGIVGQLVKDLAFTIIFSLTASIVVALTLVPLFFSKMRNVRDSSASTYNKMQKHFGLFENALSVFIKKRKVSLLITLIIFIISILMYFTLDKELMPKMDQGQFTIKVNMPSGTNLDITNGIASKIENFLLSLPYAEEVSVIVGSTRGKSAEDFLQRLGSHQAEIFVNLESKRKIETKDVIQLVKGNLSAMDLEGADIEYILPESIFSTVVEESSPVVVKVQGKELTQMINIVEEVKGTLNNIKGIYNIRTDMPEASPETKVLVDKDKAAAYQFSVVDIAQTSQAAIRGYVASEFKEKGQEIDIRVRLREQDRDDFNKLERIQLTSQAGVKVPLTSLVKFARGMGPSEIKRLDQERTILVSANIFKRALKDVVNDVGDTVKKLNIPNDYTVKLAGESEEMKQSFVSLRNALILSIILVFMIMAAQFESILQPFIIMFTFPLSLIGVVFAIFITNTTVNVNVFLGVIILGGIVVNNGIVLIDYINQLINRGMPVFDALIEGSKTRLRPILMTALTTIFGFMPMAFSKGEGSEFGSSLAICVMGGLTISTFMSLFVIPAIFMAFHSLKLKIFGK